MMQFEYNKPIEALLKKVKSLASSNNGELKGDNENGTFDIKSPIGNFQGTYLFKNNKISIDIKKKPFLVSTKLIEQEVKKYLSKN